VSGLGLREISAGYGRVQVLDGVSLDVGAREAVALLGPNGSGKSTLVKTVMGLTTLYEGSITWEGDEITTVPAWKLAVRGIGYVPQVDNVFVRLGVEEQLELGGLRLPKKQRREQIAQVYELFPELAERRRIAAGSLSGGERRMLAVGAALMERPRLLVLDEPTSDLAPVAIDLMFEKIVQIRAEFNVALLLVEQNVRRALELSTRVCVLVRGTKVVDRDSSTVDEEELGPIFLQHAGEAGGGPESAH
jgi:ABC-type branched-subunit amino acid transport system ATPase component